MVADPSDWHDDFGCRQYPIPCYARVHRLGVQDCNHADWRSKIVSASETDLPRFAGWVYSRGRVEFSGGCDLVARRWALGTLVVGRFGQEREQDDLLNAVRRRLY